MTIVQLQYLTALDNYGSFAEAAKHSFVTQPTLSMQIQKLEEEVGAVLFDRSRQFVKATELGKKIIEQARIVLREYHHIYDIISNETNELDGAFRLGIIPTIAPYLLPRFLKDFTSKHKKILLRIEECQTDDIIKKLKRDELDAAILATPLNDKEIIERPLYYEPFLAYVSMDNELSSKNTIAVSELQIKDVWLLKEGHCFRDQVLKICKTLIAHEDEIQISFEADSFETLIKLVENNFGITLLPFLAVKELSTKKREKYVREFSEPIPQREVSIVFHRKHLKKKAIDALENEILKNLPDELNKKINGLLINVK